MRIFNDENVEQLNKLVKDFKVEIGTVFKDDKRNFVITDREYRYRKLKPDKKGRVYTSQQKWYKYHCNRCSYSDGWIEESNLLQCKQGCPCCSTPVKKVVLGINSIYDTDRYLISDYGLDEEFSKTHTIGTGKKGKIICKDCGSIKFLTPRTIKYYRSIGCSCGDGFSYPEKFMFNILKQINIDFTTQLSKSTFKWCNKYKYDFYIPSINTIIETHGEQHYSKHRGCFKRTLEQEIENDKYKKQLALNNGICKYITIDCRESNTEFIKQSIMNCELNELFDLSNIDWLKAEEHAINSNLIKEVCNYWNNKKEWESTTDLAREFGLAKNTIIKYLKQGNKQEWCKYNPKKEMKINGTNNLKSTYKKINILKNNINFGEFESIAYASRKSKELFGVYLGESGIHDVLSGKTQQYKGFTFNYI